MFMPFHILGLWFRGLLSIAILVGGIYLMARWYDDSRVSEGGPPAIIAVEASPAPGRAPEVGEVVIAPRPAGRRIFRFDAGWNRPTYELAGALALLTWATSGLWIGRGISLLTMRSGTKAPARPAGPGPGGSGRAAPLSKRALKRKAGGKKPATAPIPPEPDDDPEDDRSGEVHLIRRPDGSELRVECYGPVDAPPIVWTHGWGANSTEWFYQKRHLAGRFRLIIWDEPGLGLSKKPDNNDYRLENLAADLDAVLGIAAGRPAILVGHSIGGMITLTFCKDYPEALGTRVAGLVLAHTSYTNPVRTGPMPALCTAIEKPVLIPMMHATIALWPLAWVMSWLNYFNGSTHRSSHKSGFSGNETRGQLDHMAALTPRARPDVLARGMLGMIRYDATHVLASIPIPTLVFVGDLDTTTQPSAGEHIARTVPRGELITLKPAKHMGLLEHHDQFDRAVAEFAARCQPVTVAR